MRLLVHQGHRGGQGGGQAFQSDARLIAHLQPPGHGSGEEHRQPGIARVQQRGDAAARGQHGARLGQAVFDAPVQRRAQLQRFQHGLRQLNLRLRFFCGVACGLHGPLRGLQHGGFGVKRQLALFQLHGRNLLLAQQALRLLPLQPRQRRLARLRGLPGAGARLLRARAGQRGARLRQFGLQFAVFLHGQHLPGLHALAFLKGRFAQAARVFGSHIHAREFQPSVGAVNALGQRLLPRARPPLRPPRRQFLATRQSQRGGQKKKAQRRTVETKGQTGKSSGHEKLDMGQNAGHCAQPDHPSD